MSLFRPFQKPEDPQAETHRLLEENNSLLRELIHAITGRQALTTARQRPAGHRIMDASDVSYVSRNTVLAEELRRRQQQADLSHTPRNGPGSAPPASNGGSAPTPPAPQVVL